MPRFHTAVQTQQQSRRREAFTAELSDERYVDIVRRATAGLSPEKKAEYEDNHLADFLPCEVKDDGYRTSVLVPSLSQYPLRYEVIRDWQATPLRWLCPCPAGSKGIQCHHVHRAIRAWERYEYAQSVGAEECRAEMARRYPGMFRTERAS